VTVPSFLAHVVDLALTPFELLISHVLAGAHAALAACGLPAASGVTWAASIAVLVLVVRLALLPLMIRQVRAAAVHAETGAGPLGCLPVLAQAPVLLALFRVLTAAAHGSAVGAMTPALVAQLDAARLGGAALAAGVHAGGGAVVVAAALTAVMAGALWLTQHRQLTRNTPASALEGVAGRSQRAALWVLPLVTVGSGLTFPIGVLVYFACSNTWTLAQQAAIIRWLPAPGSPAHAARSRRARR
jgi:YidC/Oxa1 family membrane protein insertase